MRPSERYLLPASTSCWRRPASAPSPAKGGSSSSSTTATACWRRGNGVTGSCSPEGATTRPSPSPRSPGRCRRCRMTGSSWMARWSPWMMEGGRASTGSKSGDASPARLKSGTPRSSTPLRSSPLTCWRSKATTSARCPWSSGRHCSRTSSPPRAPSGTPTMSRPRGSSSMPNS